MAKDTKGERVDENAEECLCGALILDAERVVQMCVRAGVKEETFESPMARKIWGAAKALFDERQPVDAFSVWERSVKRGKALTEAEVQRCLELCPTPAHAEYYLNCVAQGALGRELRGMASDVFKGLAEGGGAAKVYDDLVRRIRGAEGKAYGGNAWVNLDAETDKIEAEWRLVSEERLVKGNKKFINGVPMPWEVMNRLYTGLKEGVHVLAARPSQGKTAMAVNICEFWDQVGIKHAVVSIDMSSGNLFKRFASSIQRVSLPKMEWGAKPSEIDAAVKRLREMAARGNLLMTEEDGIERIRSVVCEAVHRHGARVVLVDYLQVVNGQQEGRRMMQRNEEVGLVMRELKALAKQLKIPIVLLCQLSREVSKEDGRKPRLDDLGDSGEIERAATSVAFLHVDKTTRDMWAEYPPVDLAYGYEYLAKHLRPVFYILAKNQNGSTGEIPFVLYPNYFMFRPGDALAKSVREQVPNTRREEMMDYPKFSRICDDWRVLPEDDHLQKKGILGPRKWDETR